MANRSNAGGATQPVIDVADLPLDPEDAAKAARLHHVTDAEPGIRRERRGKGWRYIAPDGQPVTDERELRRIASLAIPPAWTDVWICPSPRGHLQATGRDAKRRKQYRYHPRWRAVRDETKYERMIPFAETLPRIHQRVRADLALPGLPREKVLAVVVQLLEETLIRVGNSEYARDNHSFGLTTLRDRHVHVAGATITFEYRGKSGKRHTVDLRDRRLAAIVKRCRAIPGYELFQYVDEDGQRHSIDSSAVNDYLRDIAGDEYTAKDFRTWAGTVLAACALQDVGPFDDDAQAKHNVVQAVERVAERLGNTPAVSRKCYIHPAIIDAYLRGEAVETPAEDARRSQRGTGEQLDAAERAVLRFLKRDLKARADGAVAA